MPTHAQYVRLNEWWPAAIIGLLASAVLGAQDGRAQSLSFVQADAQRVAERMAANSHDWRQDFRSYVGRGSDRKAIVERTKDVLGAYRDRCEESCSAETVRAAVQTAAGSACAASVMPVTIDPSFVPPRGTFGFDFQPQGARTANGFRPVLPNDPRLVGGQTTLSNNTKDDLSFDSLKDVKRFRAEQLPDGEYRVIVIGAAGAAEGGTPFGSEVSINGRTVDVGSGALSVVAQLGDSVRNVRVTGTSKAPMLVFDLTIDQKVLDLSFLTGATVSGLVVEPVTNKSVLDMAVAAGGITSMQQCMSASTELQLAASDGVVAKKNRLTDIASKLGNGTDNSSGGSTTVGTSTVTSNRGGGSGAPQTVVQLSGN